MRALSVVPLVVSACFNPKLAEHLACGTDGACPPGLSCGADLVCHRVGDLPDASSNTHDGVPADGAVDAAPDAAPVGCQSNVDCATPPDACSEPGTCNLTTHVCTFQPVTCTQLDSECAIGVCNATNGCFAMPRNEHNSCGLGTTCGTFGPCGNFADACAETGTQSRSCTVNTCQAGACVGASSVDVEACQGPSTDGVVCGSQTASGCTGCGGFSGGVCDETGTQSCTCFQPTCANGTCSAQVSSSCVLGCTRDTDGVSCGAAGRICSDGLCECPSC